MLISAPRKSSPRAGTVRIEADISFDRKGRAGSWVPPKTLWFEWCGVDSDELDATADGFAIAMLPLAMRLGEALTSLDPICERMQMNLVEAHALLNFDWPGTLHPIELNIPTEHRPPSCGQDQIATFFSGGVDSCFNVAAMHRRANEQQGADISELWLVRGFDIHLDQTDLWHETVDKLSTATTADGKLVLISTNIRDFYRPVLDWAEIGCGPAMGAIAKFSASRCNLVLIGSASIPMIHRYGTTVALDHMWSCTRQTIFHHSISARFLDKVRTIINETPHLAKVLRICWRNPGQQYNCGKCEKCVRAQIALLALGGEGFAQSFPAGFSPAKVLSVRLPPGEPYYWHSYKALRRLCAANSEHEAYARAITGMLWLSRIRAPFARLVSALKRAVRNRRI